MRMQHYAIFLRSFNYNIRYRRSEYNSNADCLSRLPVTSFSKKCDVADLHYLEMCDILSLDHYNIHQLVKEDTKLSTIAFSIFD